jgi:RHS repeat-associated protein
VWLPSYDAADQLTNIVSTGGPSAVTNYGYAYDSAGNRLVAATNGVQTTFTYNALDQLANSTLPTNNITYEWDGENRLTAINNGTNRSEFYYDGLGKRTEIIERQNGVGVSTNTYLWCGTDICEQRDLTGANVTRRFFPQGEQIASLNYYYTRDHLGSVREAVNLTATLASRYDFGPFGEMEVIQQGQAIDFAYTGHFLHSTSGLYLTHHRPLDSTTARWLNRDPLGEKTGINLYSYVDNNAINAIDPMGLTKIYGNWCGPDWTGGRVEEYSPHPSGYYRDPIDNLDGACQVHDKCYYTCRASNPCDPTKRSQCFRVCDHALTDAAYSIGGFWGNVIGAAIDRSGQRDPGPNTGKCCAQGK